MRTLHMQVADAAQKCIGVKCFRKEHYPLPDQAAAAFSAASEQVFGTESDTTAGSFSPSMHGAALAAVSETKSIPQLLQLLLLDAPLGVYLAMLGSLLCTMLQNVYTGAGLQQ